MSDNNVVFRNVCMGVAAFVGIIASLSIYSHGFFWVIAGVTAAACVPSVMTMAESDTGEIVLGFLGIFGGAIGGIIVQYGFMLIWYITKAILDFGIGNTVRVIAAIPLLIIAFIIYCISY